jgi:hypothetical protein
VAILLPWRLSPRRHAFRSGRSLAILPSIMGGWAAHMGNVGLLFRFRETHYLERIAKLALIAYPVNSKIVYAIIILYLYIGRYREWVQPKIALILDRNNESYSVFQGMLSACRALQNDERETAIRYFRDVSSIWPTLKPFCYGRNMIFDDQLSDIISRKEMCELHGYYYSGEENKDSLFTILISCDQNYLRRFGVPFLKGVRNSQKNCCVYIHLVDPPPLEKFESLLSQLRKRFPELSIAASSSLSLNFNKPNIYACIRYLLIPILLKRQGHSVVVLDIDSVPKSSLHTFFEDKYFDVCCFHTGGGTPWTKYNASFLVVRATEAGMQVARAIANYQWHILNNGDAVWMLDQVSLWSVFANLHRLDEFPIVLGVDELSLSMSQHWSSVLDRFLDRRVEWRLRV